MTNYEYLQENQLEAINGGSISVGIWAVWGGLAAAGFTGGISVGLNKKNRK